MAYEQQKLDRLLFRVLFLLVVGIVVTQTLGMVGITSYLFLLTFPVTVMLWLRCVRKTVTGLDMLLVATVCVAAMNVLINASFASLMPGFDYIKKLINFAMALMFLQTAHRMRIQADTAKFINHMVDFLVLYLIVIYFALNVQMFDLYGRLSIYLTFRFDNPNMTGLFLTCLYMLELYRLFSRERWYWKVLHIVMAAFLAMFVTQTQSRNCLIIMVVFTAFCAWRMFFGKKRLRLGRITAALMAVLPILFVALYFLMVYAPWVQETFSFLVSKGKDLDSRMIIWQPAVENLARSPIIGAYYEISGGTGTGQMHNTHLDIACSYGIPVLVMVCMLLWNYLNQKNRVYTNKGSYIYMLGFACSIMLGLGESALFSGGLGMYVLVGSFLLLASYSEEESSLK